MKKKLFILEWKCYLRQFPFVLGLFAALLLLISLAFYTIMKILYPATPIVQAPIALVTEDYDDPYIQMAFDLLEEMKSTSQTIEIIPMTEKEAYTELEKGKLTAVLVFPPGLVDSILNGTNHPVKVIFQDRQDLMSILFHEIINSATRLLSEAQAGIYTAAELYENLGAPEELPRTFQMINLTNFSFVMVREDTFIEVPISFSGTSNLLLFYIVSLITLLALFAGCAYAGSLTQDNSGFLAQLSRHGIGQGTYYFHKVLSFTSFQFVCLLLFFLLLKAFERTRLLQGISEISLSFNFGTVLCLFVLALFFSCYTVVLSRLPENPSTSILFFFFIGFLLIFISGGILPFAFLPAPLRALSNLLPGQALFMTWTQLLQGQTDFSSLARLLPSLGMLLLWSAGIYLFGLCKELLQKNRTYR